MAVLKPISGHGTLVGNHTRDYIEGYGRYYSKYHGHRCQKVTYINIAPDSPGVPNWAERMDDDRHATGCDIQLRDKPVRTYNHYIFSPAPDDKVSAEELDEALHEWADRVFQNKFSIVIGYHNDNFNNVQHAHMIINNVNWDVDDPVTRVGNYVNHSCWEYASQLWQYICKEHGWYSFIEKQQADIAEATLDNDWQEPEVSREVKHLYEIDEEFFKKHRYFDRNTDYSRPFRKIKVDGDKYLKKPFTTKDGKFYTTKARTAKAHGKHLWSDDLRDLIEIAYYASSQIPEFLNTLAKLDVNVRINNSHDFVYQNPTNGKWVTGAKLGNDYKKYRLIKLFRAQESFLIRKYAPLAEQRDKLISKAREIGWTETSEHIGLADVGTHLTVHDVAKALKTCSLYCVWDIADINKYTSGADDPILKQTLSEVKDVLGKLGSLQPTRKLWEDEHPNRKIVKSAFKPPKEPKHTPRRERTHTETHHWSPEPEQETAKPKYREISR